MTRDVTSRARRAAGAAGGAAGPIGAGLAVLVVLALLGVAAVLPGESVPAPSPVPVSGSSRLVCPVPADERARLSVLAPGADLDEVEVTGLAGDPVPGLTTTDGVLAGDVEETVVLQAGGETATALAGIITRTAGDGPDPGLSQVGCQPAASGGWLVGLTSTGDRQAAVVLTNPDDRQAVVNLAVHDEQGLRQVPGSREITVGPRSARVVELGPLLTPTGTMAVQVQATTGRVLALGRQRSSTETGPLASEWLTASAEPAPQQVLAGVPGGDGARRLVVLNPGERRAQVRLEALGESGGFVPAGAPAEIDVPPAGTATVELDEGFSTDGTTLRLSGSQPVTATLAATDADGDLALVPAAAPVTGNGFGVGEVPDQPEQQSRLVLGNAGTETATARVLPLAGSDQQEQGDEVSVPPASSVVVSGTGLGRLEVDSGQLHAAVVLTGDDGLSSLPLAGTAGADRTRVPERDPRLW